MLVATNYQVLGNQPEEVQRFRDNSLNLIEMNKHQTKEAAEEERGGRRERTEREKERIGGEEREKRGRKKRIRGEKREKGEDKGR